MNRQPGRFASLLPIVLALATVGLAAAPPGRAEPTRGPLRVSEVHPNYFADASGLPVYLAGSHTWANLQERQYAITPDFDYDAYLDLLVSHDHNFMRLWTWEQAHWQQWDTEDNGPIRYSPMPFERTGPGEALDGGPRFDLTRWNEAWFQRLRERVDAARVRGIYVSVMLFQGFSTGVKGIDPATGRSAWDGHPFHPANNVNGIDGNPDGDAHGNEIHSGRIEDIRRIQEAFVGRCVDAVNDLDNVLWEIGNELEAPPEFVDGMARLVRTLEAAKPHQHPIGASGYKNTSTGEFAWKELLAAPVDFIQPWEAGGDWMGRVPAVDGAPVFITDTDHGDPWKTDPVWVWRAFCRGHNPIIMDKYKDARLFPKGAREPDPEYETIRRALGDSRRVSLKVDLGRSAPRGRLSSTGYCLAAPGRSYVVLNPEPGPFDLHLAAGTYAAEWLDVVDGSTNTDRVAEPKGATRRFDPPAHASDHAVVLVLVR